jgi:CHAT domain-containing protein
VSLAAGRPAEALARARKAAAIAGAYEQREVHWESETLAGIAQRRLGQLAAARESFEAAVAVIEDLRLQVAGRGERFLETKLSPYHELMALARARGSAEEALELAERSKARVLADLVHRAAYESYPSAVDAQHPEPALRRAQAPPLRFAEAAALVPRGPVALLEYTVTERETYLFVLTASGGSAKVAMHTLGAGRAALAARARRFRERLAARDLGFALEARQLYDLLVGPAGTELAGRTHLIVVPDGPLWDVPFQALQDTSGRYVIEDAAVSYAPSLTVLRETTRRPRRAVPPTVLAMGKADFGSQASQLGVTSELGPLPDAERQVRAIAALYGPGRSDTYVGADAREDTFKREAPRHAILHLATHGVLDETSPLYSHVVLSPGAAGSSEDGLLEAWEMANLHLDADVVILSACETGRGRIAPGEGLVGMAWSLLVAGSRALLVSQWKVEAASTTELMITFHRGLASGEGGLAMHLREASLHLLHQPRYAHPFYWAGFVLVGDSE